MPPCPIRESIVGASDTVLDLMGPGVAVQILLVNRIGLPSTGTTDAVDARMFSVLSGYLIVRLLVEERRSFGSVSPSHSCR